MGQQRTNIPTFRISTENNTPVTQKETWIDGTITIESSVASEEMTQYPLEIRGRGNSTWGMEKKPYRIKLSEKKQLLGLPAKEKNWVLLANYADKTLIRNAIAFEISRYLGLEFTPSTRFVDLVLNGEFLGNYMVTDQIEVANFRVPVQKQEVTATTLPDISGGYLLEIDGFADSELVWFSTNKGVKITIKYPKDDEINQAQRNYITNYVKEAENCLFSSSFKSEEEGYRKYFDMESLINWYIAAELTGNPDACWSTYLYKKKEDDKIYVGPLWDFDIAFNNDDRLGDATQKLMLDAGHGTDLMKKWLKRFIEDEYFVNEVKKRFTAVIDRGIHDHLQSYIDSLTTHINTSQSLNFDRWKILDKKVYRELAARKTYTAEVNFVTDYVTRRVDFLKTKYYDSSLSSIGPDITNNDNGFTASYSSSDKKFMVHFSLTEQDQIGFSVMSIDGRLISNVSPSLMDAGEHSLEVPCTHIPAGVYLIVKDSFRSGRASQKCLVR